MSVVELQSNVYDVYADVQEANIYLAASVNATAWNAASEDTKTQALVSATRTLDRQCWQGEKTLDSDPLQWPRKDTGITGVSDDIVPEDIINGSIELANLLLSGSTVQSTTTPNLQGLQIIKAGSASLTYFRPGPESMFDQTARFPVPVQELVGKYLCGSVPAVVGIATGVCVTDDKRTQSVTDDEYGYTRGI